MIRRLRSLDDRRYAWVVVAASFLMLVIGNGALFLLVVAMKDIAASFDWPRTVPSTAYSLQFIGGGLAASPWLVARQDGHGPSRRWWAPS